MFDFSKIILKESLLGVYVVLVIAIGLASIVLVLKKIKDRFGKKFFKN